MLTLGEFDFDSLFFNEESDPVMSSSDNPDPLQPELLYPIASYILWIVFVVLMPIVLTNLLVSNFLGMRTLCRNNFWNNRW